MPGLPRTVAPATRAGAVAMTVVSMSSVQLSDAFSVPLIGSLGAVGAAWLRVSLGALLLFAVVRPRVHGVTAAQWGAIVPLGVFTATLSASFMAALQQLPLGATASLAFLGP